MNKVSNNILLRVYLLFGLFVFFGALIVLRIIALQVNKDVWVQKEMEEKVFFKRLVADRGNILAEDGTIMATSIPFYKLSIDPSRLDTNSVLSFSDSLYKLSLNIATYFPAQPDTIDTLAVYNKVKIALAKGDRHLYLTRKKVNFKELEMVQQWPILRNSKYQGGLIAEKFNNERFYPMGDLARITLGTMSGDTLGIRGIEHSFNSELRGRDGYILAQKVVGKSYVPLDQYGEERALDGYDITTTLDVDMQDVVENALRKGVERHYAKFGVAVLMEVETGKIKAIANYPETQNHAIATQLEPGSTFKTVSAAALFEDKLMDICDTIDTGDGTMMYDDKEISDNGVAYGVIDFEKVFAYSSNVGISKAVNENYGEHPEQYMKHLERFGFFHATNNQIVGEPTPRIIKPEDDEWTIATLPSLSYGYSLMVTPLQMATFYNGIANEGKLMRPWFIQKINDNSKIIKQYGPEALNSQMCSKETAIKVRELMKAVVDYGTASRAFKNMPFLVAGKTGTARKTKRGVGYIRKYRSSMGGFFPADNPRYTLYVLLDEPDAGTSSGGRVAGPIFREISEEIYAMDLRMSRPKGKPDLAPKRKPTNKVIYAESAKKVYQEMGIRTSNVPEAEWLAAESNGHQVNLKPLEVADDRVPNVKGMTGRDAISLLENMGIKVTLKGMGRVRRQSLLPGFRIGPETSITLFLG